MSPPWGLPPRPDSASPPRCCAPRQPQNVGTTLCRHARWRLQPQWTVFMSLPRRIGILKPGEDIVLVVTISAHRKAAFEAAAFLMDYLKTSAPFWKKETGLDGVGSWVDAREADDDAMKRWE